MGYRKAEEEWRKEFFNTLWITFSLLLLGCLVSGWRGKWTVQACTQLEVHAKDAVTLSSNMSSLELRKSSVIVAS